MILHESKRSGCSNVRLNNGILILLYILIELFLSLEIKKIIINNIFEENKNSSTFLIETNLKLGEIAKEV